MNTHKAMKLPFGFLAVALISMSSPAVLTAPRPLQIIWEQTAQEGGTFSVDFSPDRQKLASGGAYIVQSGAQLYYAENKVWRTGRSSPRHRATNSSARPTKSPSHPPAKLSRLRTAQFIAIPTAAAARSRLVWRITRSRS